MGIIIALYIIIMSIMYNIMKGTKVQTLGVRAVAGVCMVHGWCMAGCLGHKNNYGHGCNY